MTPPRGSSNRLSVVLSRLLSSAPFAQTFAVCAIAATFLIPLARNMIGWPGVVGMLCTLGVLSVVVLIGRREYVDWRESWPLSIFAFMAWCLLSLIWSGYPQDALVGIAYQIVIALVAMTIALTRDMIQIVRAVGGVMRVLLSLSLFLEMLSGIFIDTPIDFLSIEGNLAQGGPIQGIFVTRNMLSLVALLALITFFVEWRTHSVDRHVAWFSLALAALCLVFSQSPVNLLVVLMVAVAALALAWLRRSPAERRSGIQAFLLTVSMLSVIVVYLLRYRIVGWLNAESEFGVRYHLWEAVWRLVKSNFIEGWGWTGAWQGDLLPYLGINLSVGREHSSALNAYLDVYLQVGLVGIFLFLTLCIFAFLRSWMLASNRRSLIYTWPALVLVALLAVSAAESTILYGPGWLLLVICAARASQSMSWRDRIVRRPSGPQTPPDYHPDHIR